MKHKKHTSAIILIASLLLTVILMDSWMIFNQTRMQTRNAGIYQMETIRGELGETISNAENLTMELAIEAREYIDDKEVLKKFLYKKKEENLGDNGLFNIYAAGHDWAIIPGFDYPEEYIASERRWYKAAIKNGGRVFVTSPYQDAMTGDICYTASVMLGDRDTVLAVDYTMESIQRHIREMYQAGSHSAVIVTDEGIIAGCADETMIGKEMASELPEYTGIYSLSKSSEEVTSLRIKADFLYENLFAAKTGNGWYLIIGVGDWDLYKDSYIQLSITVLLAVALFILIIFLYLFAIRNQRRAEDALSSKEEFLDKITGDLREPLTKILSTSSWEHMDAVDDYEKEMAGIHAAGEKLSEMIGQIISYSSVVRAQEERSPEKKQKEGKATHKRFRTLILVLLSLVMCISLYTSISATYRWGNEKMKNEAAKYEFMLAEWINTHKSILDMFASVISTNPDMVKDYEGTVAYLNRITEQYPEISVTYMTNPAWEHSVIMNNGYEPDKSWHVEDREWYQDTMASEAGWSISAPYYDVQTGGYCVTFSKQVLDAKTGEILGVFGIDFFMDKLVDILGGSYSDHGYAFLVDTQGNIINHPYGKYQMTQEKRTDVSGLPYGKVEVGDGHTHLIRDYDGSWRILGTAKNEASRFAVYVVDDVWMIYGKVFVYGLVCLAAFLGCMAMVYHLLSDMIAWQETANRRMRNAARTAISAGQAKSQFLAQMSHEIRTPINAVLGMNEMILRESEDEAILDYAANIQMAGRTLLSLINSILDFSKIEDGKMEIVPVRYDLASTIQNLVNSIQERAKGKGLELYVDVDETLPSVLFGDDVRISQVIMNLLTNAVKYTEKGSVVLSFKNRKSDDNDVVMEVCVSDTGIGIRQEDMGKLFASFERIEETRNRNIEGTGLGMSIVTKLLEMMGSRLVVESVYGKGSAFSFELPQSIVDKTPIGNYTQRLAQNGHQEATQKWLYANGADVLVVDDSEMNLKVAKNLMKRSGIIPDLAISGSDAIDRIRSKRYHIVFLDHMMPKMDGIETLRRLREEGLLEEGVTVIALTANAVEGARDKYLNAGFDDYLSKPIDAGELEKKLGRYLPEAIVEWRSKDESDQGYPGSDGHKPRVHTDAEASAGAPESDTTSGAEGSRTAVISEAPEEIQDSGVPAGTEGSWETNDGGDILEFAPWEDSENTPEESGILAEQDLPEAFDGLEMDGILEQLQQNGFDVDSAIAFCAGDEEFYRELLDDFAAGAAGKAEEMESYYSQKEWGDYEVLVHALKSTSKTIGLDVLSDLARGLEAAARDGDMDFVTNNHSIFLQDYRRMAEWIRQILSANP